ncbi:MAG: aminoglycoside phosphotransferase family protein [Oscillospiraceae bacterium]|nr:aminoglycoside phosphotransferase family protein [Oscillospiraceae bacterium]
MNLTKPIAERPSKKIYRDGNYAVKLMNEEYSASDVLNEALNLSIVHETGFAVPALHEVRKIDGKWAIIMDYVEGRTLFSLMNEDPASIPALLERMVDLQLKMHTYKAKRLRHLTDKFHAKIDQSGLDATTRYELRTRLHGLPKHNKLCHGDFTPGNIIITPDGDGVIIDWSHATQGNASADAARTYLRFLLAERGNQAEAYLKLFCDKSDTARQYVNKWLAIVAASQMVKGNPEEREMLLRWAQVVEYE